MPLTKDDKLALEHGEGTLSRVGMAHAIAGGWVGDDDRDAVRARRLRKLVRTLAPPPLAAKLAAHGLDRAPRISTATRLERVARDLATDPAVDGDALALAFVEQGGSTAILLALAEPERATSFLRSRTKQGALDLTLLGLRALPDAIATLPNVQSIDASHNRVRDVPAALAAMPRLHALHLAYNEMSVVPPGVFACRHLTALSLTDNALTRIPDAIGELRSLRDLWLSDNPLTELPRAMLALRELRFLHLGGLPWKEPSPLIAEMTSLEELWLASDTLEHLPASICKLPKLRRLHVWYSKLASVPDELFSCTKLVELRIGHNPLPESTYARLRKALPRCTLY